MINGGETRRFFMRSDDRNVYIQRHDYAVIGTIPAGVIDDVGDGGGISESSAFVAKPRTP